MFGELMTAFRALKIGELLDYQTIETIIGKNPRSEGRPMIERAIKKLRRHPYGIAIVNKPKAGYFRANLDVRTDWVAGKRDHVRRTLIEGYISSTVIDEGEFAKATEDQKRKLAIEGQKTGFELLIAARMEKAKRLPSPDKLSPMSSFIGELIDKRKRV